MYPLLLKLNSWITLVVMTAILLWPGDGSSPAYNDKLVHLLAFGYLGASFALYSPVVKGWHLVLLGVGYAVATEVAQHFIPYRSFEWGDLLADSVGITFGVLLLKMWLSSSDTSDKR